MIFLYLMIPYITKKSDLQVSILSYLKIPKIFKISKTRVLDLRQLKCTSYDMI